MAAFPSGAQRRMGTKKLTREGNMNNKKSPTVTPNLVEPIVYARHGRELMG